MKSNNKSKLTKKTMGKPNLTGGYKFVSEIRQLIKNARSLAVRSIDMIQVLTNFQIGKRIVEQEQKGRKRAKYGNMLLALLSDRLTEEFGKGFSRSNLEYMRRFYLIYKKRVSEKSQMPSGELTEFGKSQMPNGNSHSPLSNIVEAQKIRSPFCLSWSQYVFLLGIKNEEERNFYEIEACSNGWSLPELRRQFNTGLYERLALSRNKTEILKLAKQGQIVTKPSDLLKEPYVLEFLGIDEKLHYSESDLESAIIDKLEHFLLELGKGFLFEARQKRFTFDDEHYYVDLVFYNRILRSYILIDLKIGRLTHQDLGQMQMYVNYYDRHVKIKPENPTVGIILCRKKHDALVKITLPHDTNIHAKEYQLYLPDKEILKKKLLDWTKDRENEI